MHNDESWDAYFINLAQAVSLKSKDPSTKIGCVIVGPDNEIRSTGYNGFPRGIQETYPPALTNEPQLIAARWERPAKYQWVEHAERNAIYNAARSGVSLKDCRIYLNTPFPCTECAKAIIQSGIVYLAFPDKQWIGSDNWEESFRFSKELLFEAQVKIKKVWLDKP